VPLETVWFHVTGLVLGNSVWSTSIVLSSFMAGIALGNLATSRLGDRQPRLIVTYACLEAVVAGVGGNLAAMALLASGSLAATYFGFQYVMGVDWTADWYRILWFTVALAAPMAVLSGVLFTLLAERLRLVVDRDLRAAGWLTLANTVGAACGPLLSAFVLLPVLGMERSLFGLMLVYVMIAALTCVRIPASRHRDRNLLLGGVALAAGGLIAFPFGLMATRYFPRVTEKYGGDGSRIIASREGRTETILLMEQSWLDLPVYQRLVTDGFSMSGTHLTGKRYMRLFVYWPMLLHAAPLKQALVLCYGVGTTVQAATEIDAVESIDVVEISSDVVAMSDSVYRGANNPLHDPRVRLHVEDGRAVQPGPRHRPR
jgi:predicted membrane-bound spermidine synthase